MGLFSFVKDAGQKLLGWSDDAETQPEAAAAAPAAAVVSAASLHMMLNKLGLAPADLSVGYDDGNVTIAGTVESQAQREKIILAIGNVQGVGQVDDQTRIANEPAPAVFYTVVSGDTLGAIAKAQYGNATKYPVIFEANKPMLSDPDKIYPGQVLRIPALDD